MTKQKQVVEEPVDIKTALKLARQLEVKEELGADMFLNELIGKEIRIVKVDDPLSGLFTAYIENDDTPKTIATRGKVTKEQLARIKRFIDATGGTVKAKVVMKEGKNGYQYLRLDW